MKIYLILLLAMLAHSESRAECYRIIQIPCADFIQSPSSTCAGTTCTGQELFDGDGVSLGTFPICPSRTEETEVQQAPIDTVVSVELSGASGKTNVGVYGGQFCLGIISCNDGQICAGGSETCEFDNNGYVDSYRDWVQYWSVYGDDCPVAGEEEQEESSGWYPIVP